MKFSQYYAIREADEAQEIDAIFNQASTDIQHLFDQLYKGTAGMVRNYQKAGLPEELKRQVLKDLTMIAKKIKGGDEGNTMTDPRGTAGQQAFPTENVMVNTYIKSIVENIQHIFNEADDTTEAPAQPAQHPSIIKDLGSHGTGVGGKPAYDFKTVITNVHRLVMDRMTQLKDAVLKHMGIIRDTHSKVLGLRTTTGNIRNKVGDLSTQVGQGFDKLSNRSQPFQGQEEDRAQDSMIALSNAVSGGFQVKIRDHDGKEIPINPRSETWRQHILKAGHKHKLFTLVGPNGETEEVNIGNPDQIHTVLGSWGYSGTSKFVPTPQKKGRSLGLRDQSGKVVKEE